MQRLSIHASIVGASMQANADCGVGVPLLVYVQGAFACLYSMCFPGKGRLRTVLFHAAACHAGHFVLLVLLIVPRICQQQGLA